MTDRPQLQPPAKSKRKKNLLRRLTKWRHPIQAAFLIAFLMPASLQMHQIVGPVFHCYASPLATFACPMGVIANFSALRIFPFVAVGTLLIVGGLFAGFVCGWACPFGLLQDLLAKIPIPKFTLPYWTGYTRYAVLLGLVLLIPFFFGKDHSLFICRVCPAGGVEAALPHYAMQRLGQGGGAADQEAAQPGEAAEPIAAADPETPDGGDTAGEAEPDYAEITGPSLLKWSIIGVFLVAALVKARPWCTLLCPLGAIFGAMNRVSFFYLKIDRSKCNSCGVCRTKLCPYGLDPSVHIDDPRCVRCLECTRCRALDSSSVLSRKPLKA